MASKLFPSLAATAFAAMLFHFCLKRRRPREINGGEANNNAAANDGTAGGACSIHTSTEVHEMATSSGANKDAAANDGTARGDSGAHTSTEVPEMAPSSERDYEVFLSFRGPDTRAGFTNFLYTSLIDSGIRAFKDDEDLRIGEEFTSELLQAINRSKISIPIFSKGYASSVWCLKELVQMVKCQKTTGQKIMPIFYDVVPSEVRHQTGGYGEAFLSLENKKRYDEETMREWKDALKEVSFINGWELHNMPNRRAGEFAKKLTQKLFSELKKANLMVSDCLVNVDNQVDAIMDMLSPQTRDCAAFTFNFFFNRRSREIDGGEANDDAAANDETARGASSTQTSTEGQGMVTSSGYDYEVFLSFRGPDIRATFTDHLYTRLEDYGIRTFKDDESLRKGEEFAPELLEAIKQSKILIPIFSKDYASSVWCLKEVAQMVECKKTGEQKIIPIFYDVAPAEVRYQREGYGRALLSHESKKRYDQKTIGEWKAALSAVGEINGWDLQSMPNRREAVFVRTIAQMVFHGLKKASLVVSDYFVSVDNHVDAIMEMIGAKTNETRIIGIHGMGGIGKTTIAKIIYNKLLHDFENSCFLPDIRETSKRSGIPCLQNQLISNLLKTNCTNIKDYDEGTQTIKDRLSNKRVLLLLDDVEEKNHMCALVGKRDWFGKGSKLIITTRKKDVLNVPQVDGCYEVNGMNDEQSLQLFSKHTFGRDYPLKEYIDQSKMAIKIAGGLPLALEVIGSLLFSKNKEMWDATLEKLAKIPPQDVQGRLKISYDALDDKEKEIFLDIACFFIGYDKDILTYFWDATEFFPKVAMEVLLNMSLIKIREDNEVWMHDQLRDLGRNIVRQESNMKIEKQSRVWEKGLNLLRRPKVYKEVGALRLKLDHQQQYHFTYEDFESLSNLRFLEMGGWMENFRAEERLLRHESPSNVVQNNENSNFLPHLQWLSWHNIPPTFNITIFSMEDVVILDLSWSDITNNWKGWSYMKVMKNLKVLDLAQCKCLERMPNISACANLEHLILQGCSNIVEIDNSICHLKRLVSLDVTWCPNLRRLPDELGDLPSLKYLLLADCKSLERLPDTIGNLESLIELNVSNTGIKELPDSIGKLENLKIVKMSGVQVRKIPDALWTFEKLEEIAIVNCYYNDGGCHVKIGSCIYRIQSLRIFRLQGVTIQALPPRLPESLIELKLRRLDMDTFPNLSNLSNLKVLELTFGPRDSYGLVGDPIPRWIGNFSKLESLTLFFHCEIASPVDLSLPPHLKFLKLDCPNLHCLPSLPPHLKSLDLKCPNLHCLPSLPPHLKSLYLQCRNLHCLPSLPSSLEFLRLYGCSSLCSLEDLSNLKNLSSLDIEEAAVKEIPGLGCLENLLVLELSRLLQVEILPDLSNLNKLSCLEVRYCPNLVEIQGELPRLWDELIIYSCDSLRKLPDLSNSNELRHLHVENCGNLVEIQGELPQSLEELEICSCGSLQKLPELSSLNKLQWVQLQGRMKLNVEAISSLCLEMSVAFEYEVEDDEVKCESEGKGDQPEYESEGDGDESECESKGEDDESECESEGEDEE